MFGYMLGLHGVLICDKEQDSDGSRVWLIAGSQALRRGHRLFVWNDHTGYTEEVFSVAWLDVTRKSKL